MTASAATLSRLVVVTMVCLGTTACQKGEAQKEPAVVQTPVPVLGESADNVKADGSAAVASGAVDQADAAVGQNAPSSTSQPASAGLVGSAKPAPTSTAAASTDRATTKAAAATDSTAKATTKAAAATDSTAKATTTTTTKKDEKPGLLSDEMLKRAATGGSSTPTHSRTTAARTRPGAK